MRVLHCVAGNLFGGVETLAVTLARCRGLAPEVEPEFALCFDGRLADGLRAEGVPVHLLAPARFSRPWTVLAARRGLRRVLEERRPGVLACHGAWAHAVCAPEARRAGVPTVFYLHDVAGGTHWLERLAGRTTPARVVANSRHTAGTSGRVFPGVPVEVVHCPVEPPPPDAAAARAAVRADLGADPGAAVVLLASRLEPLKGHAVLLEALGRLAGRPGWVAWIAGGVQRPRDRAYLDALRGGADRLGIADRVRFLGHRADVRRLMAAADVYCQPNTGPEAFGIAFVEALYSGLPVVTSRLGGAVEVVTEDCGVLVPPGDAAALAEVLGALLADPAARSRLGAAGAARAAALCDPPAIVARTGRVLSSLASPSGDTAR